MPPLDPERLNAAMRLAGMAARRLAEEIGVSEAYISQLRNGHRSASRDAAGRQKIADALGVPVDWIEAKDVAP
jgi:transcriptional regulator with XRE-family HTH domain